MKPNDRAIDAGFEASAISVNGSVFGRVSRSTMKEILEAAYAAQFKSEDYAGLVDRLRSQNELYVEKCVGTHDVDENKIEPLCNEAADALEALLAEREAWKGRQEATAALLKQIEAERDALLNAPSPAIGVDRAILGSGSDVETVWKGDQLVSISYGPAIDPSFAPPQDGFFHCVGPNGVPFSQIRPDIYVDKVWAFKQVKRVKELEAELIEARDLSWFWEIVDADGLNNVASSEKDALRKLVRDSAILDGLKAQFGNVGERDGKFTINSTFQALLDVIDLNVETSHEKIAAIEERDATIKERDALLARLAPVGDDELVKIAADAIDTSLPSLTWVELKAGARASIAAIRPHIEAAERERCAKKILETNWVDADPEETAAAIRRG